MLASIAEILASSSTFGSMGVVNFGHISAVVGAVVSIVEFEQAVLAAKPVQSNRVEN